ncbi:hypothetical protein Tco_0919464 [Tanacetum coccineum]
MSKRQPRTGGSNEGTSNILGVPDEPTVIFRASSKGTGSKPGVPDEEKGIQTLTPTEQEAADIMKALKESKKMSKRQPGTGGSNEGTGNILGVPDESTVISRASSEGTGSKPGVPDEEKLILEWEADVDSEHFNRDDNAGDDNEETKPDPEEIYNRAVQFLKWSSHGSCVNQFRTCAKKLLRTYYYNLPPRTISPDPVAIVASRAVDPVGSPSSTTIDQDEQSTSTSPTNQEIQSQVTHQGVEE